MKILVTGGAGFTGGHLARRLYNAGNHVRLIVRNKSKINISNDFEPEIIEGDIRDSDAVERAVKGVEKVFHIAAEFRNPSISNNVYWESHVKGTENLLRSSLKHNIKRFIHCSTVGVHGHIDNPPAGEKYRFKPGDIYQFTKLKGEEKAVQFSNETDLAVTVIRPCPVYGPGDRRLYKLFKAASRKIVFILGSGNIYYHMVYIDDLVDAFLLASESANAVGEVFIIAGAEILTLNELVDLIATQFDIKPIKIYLPVKPFQLIGSLCEHICIPFKINPPIYRRRVDFYTKSRAFDITKARNTLNYQPKVSLSEGLANTAIWYKKHGLL